MKQLLTFAVLGLFACGAYAADDKTTTAAPAKNSQQTKMTTCQAEATEKKLESKARQDYVNNCLKAKPAVAEKPESKMAMCNKKTAGMNKEDRAKAQSECMKAS
jgi:psiF repeat-containing protein